MIVTVPSHLQGKHEETIKECTKALELNPTYIKALVRRAEAHEKLEHFEEAITGKHRVVKLYYDYAVQCHFDWYFLAASLNK